MAEPPQPRSPSPDDGEAVEEITRLYKSLPPRPTVEEVEAAYSLLLTVEEEQNLQLHAISKKRPSNDSSPELFAVLQEMRKGVVNFRSCEQKREAEQVLEMDKMFLTFDGLVRKASALISGKDGDNLDRGFVMNHEDVTEKEQDKKNKKHGTASSEEAVVSCSDGGEEKKLNLMQLSALIEKSAKTGVTVIDLRGKLMEKIEWIPLNLGRLSALTELYLSENKIMALPNSISNLKALAKLEIRGNQLINLPNTFGELQGLTDLDLSSNFLKSLPESFGNLKNLINIDLNTNRFSTLPDTVGSLSSLQRLDVGTNDLEELPHTIGSCSSLVELILDFNHLKALPESVGKFQNLEILTLHYNRVRRLPSTMGDLLNLREIDVSFNELESIPESLCSASRLERLNVGKNFADLRTLPESIGQLEMLEELDISDNQIKYLPESFRFLTNLRYFRADQTPLELPPREIVNSGAQAVVQYMSGHVSERFANSQLSKEKKRRGLFSYICPLLCLAVDNDEASIQLSA